MGRARPFFGQANAAILRVGKATMWNDTMLGSTLMRQQGVSCRQRALPVSALHQHHAPGNISGRVDVWGRRLQVVVDHDVAALALYARGGEIQLLHVPLPAYGEHDCLGGKLADLTFVLVEQAQGPLLLLDPLDPADVRDHSDAVPLERPGDPM